MSQRERIVELARSWIGTPWHHQGRCRAGVDCAGLVILVARELGLDWSTLDLRDYGRVPDGRLLPAARRCLIQIDPDAIAPGDVLAFAVEGKQASHVAILTDHDRFCHSHNMGGRPDRHVVCEARLTGWWRRRLVAAFEFPEV